tara:strand:- start:208 stop:423 length:216 start_codon:yes stop_codon:yes gene_type:complete
MKENKYMSEDEEIETLEDAPTNEVDDMLIGRMYKKQYAQTKDDLEQIIAHKIKQRIEDKKQEFLDRSRDQT